jgi:phosphoadenosine phosphosulfate reductase
MVIAMITATSAAEEIADLADRFEHRSPQDVLAWAAERFAGRIVLTCSWQRQSSVLIDMLHRLDADVRVVELDTGLLFPETYQTRDRLVARYDLDIERILPRQSVAQQADSEGTALWARDPDRCCFLRKVEPLARALEGMYAWVTGIRRAQSASRQAARKLEWDASREIVKVQPLADWSDEDVQGYLYANDVPYNPLHDQGYPSIGCMPCTRAVQPGEDPRSGRWAGTAKTECGLHAPATRSTS